MQAVRNHEKTTGLKVKHTPLFDGGRYRGSIKLNKVPPSGVTIKFSGLSGIVKGF